jgi:peptidyl-prolyl cis-trans isomerase C
VVGLLLALAAAFGCGGEKTEKALQEAEKGNPAVCRVGDHILYESDLRVIGSTLSDVQARSGPDVLEDPAVFERCLAVAVEQWLLYKEAESSGCKVTEDDLEEKLTEIREGMGGAPGLLGFLEARQVTVAEFRENLRRDLCIRRFIEDHFTSELEITDADVETFYEQNREAFGPKQEVHARHVLITPEEPGDEKAKEEARKEAQEVLDQARAGEDFGELARTHSDGPSAPRGGDLGWFGRGQMVPPFEEAAFGLEPGEVAGPVETRFGYHVIKLEDRRSTEGRTLDEVREDIRRHLGQQRLTILIRDHVKALREQADIERLAVSEKSMESIR